MTLVEKTAINPWHYPPHFDFQYGEWLRESFKKGIIEYLFFIAYRIGHSFLALPKFESLCCYFIL